MIESVVFWAIVGGTFLLSAAVAHMPLVFARWALVPVGDARMLPLPTAAAAVVLHPTDGKASYRDSPPRAVALASLPGEEEVTRDDDVLRFVPDRNWVLARPRRSAMLVRVEISATDQGLVLRARRLPADLYMLPLGAVYLAGLHGPLLSHPFSLCLIVGAFAIHVGASQRRARRSIEAVVEEMHRRVAAADPSYTPPPTPAQVAAAQGLTWTCGCGKANEKERKTCRRCWAARPTGGSR
jgi:hypothetical protein